MVKEMVETIQAYFTGIGLEINVNMFDYEYDEPYHTFSVINKITLTRTKNGFSNPRESLFHLNDNNNELVISISKRYATNDDIQYGYENCFKHEPSGNIIHFRYKIDNIQQLKDLLVKYEDYIDYMVSQKRGR